MDPIKRIAESIGDKNYRDRVEDLGNVNQPQSMPRGSQNPNIGEGVGRVPGNPNIPGLGQAGQNPNTVNYIDYIKQPKSKKANIVEEQPDGSRLKIIKKRGNKKGR